MAYGMLAGLDPLQGLYTSLFLPLIYTFLGTSKHVAVGTFAISSLMTASVLDQQTLAAERSAATACGTASDNSTSFWACADKSDSGSSDIAQRIEIAIVLCLLVGLCQILLGALKLGFLTILLSNELIQGLTTGAACHIFSSQVKHAFGIDLGDPSGPLSLIKLYVCLFKNITQTNVAALLTSVICIVILYVTKTFIDPKTRPKIRFPIPIELIIVVVSTVISWRANFKEIFQVQVVGIIPTGIERPEVPNLSGWFVTLLPDAFSIAIVAFAIETSVAKHFAKKYNYDVDSNQEWFALGFAHLFGSFFHCHPGGASMSRSLVQGSQGGKSQIVSLVNCAVILVVLLALANLFKDLPKCVLSAIIMVALKGMFKQFANLPKIFRESKIDFLIWTVTFIAVVLLDVIAGLGIGVAFALLTVIARSLWPNAFSMQELPPTKIFHELDTFAGLKKCDQVKIFKYCSPVYFANAEYFKEKLYQHLGLNPVETKRKKLKREKQMAKKKSSVFSIFQITKDQLPKSHDNEALENSSLSLNNCSVQSSDMTLVASTDRSSVVTHLLLDCSMITYLDLMGAEALTQIYEECSEIDIQVFYANFSAPVRSFLEDCEFFSKVPKKSCFMDVSDAFERATKAKEADNLIVVHV